jgi:TolB protein
VKIARNFLIIVVATWGILAQGQAVQIGSTADRDTRTVIAVPAAAAGIGLEQYGEIVSTVIANDLRFHGLFRVMTANEYPAAYRGTPREASRINMAAWAETPAELLVHVRLTEEQGKVVAECRLFDAESGQHLVGRKSPPVQRELVRYIAHQFSDEIVLAATGVRGAATSRICYSSGANGNKEIFVSDYDGANARQVTRHNDISITPKFSPDGKKIAYVSFKDRYQFLYVFDLATGQSTPLSKKPGMNAAPSWDPNGQRMAVVLSRDGNSEIYLINANGGGLKRLTRNKGVDTSPTFSPAGDRIAFVSERLGRAQVFSMNTEGRDVQRHSYQGGAAYDPVWSPDGKWIAYAAELPGEGIEIYILDPANPQTYRRLTSSAGKNEAPSWSPDSRHVMYVSSRRGRNELWAITIDTGVDRPIALASPHPEGPNWGPRR